MPTNRYATRNDLAPDVRDRIISLLNQQLSDALDLFTQTKHAHWNVRGMQFIQLHELFDRLAETVEESVDMMAERATALGGTAMGTARMCVGSSRLPEYPLAAHDGRDHVAALTERFAHLARTSREAINAAASLGDAGTSDLFTEVSRELDQQVWFLEAHLT